MPSTEDLTKLTPATMDLRRAAESLREELEAIVLYQERIDRTEDAELKRILAHNRDEEKEHAAMLIEWLEHTDPTFAAKLKEHD